MLPPAVVMVSAAAVLVNVVKPELLKLPPPVLMAAAMTAVEATPVLVKVRLPPLVLSRDGEVRRLDQGGTVVGLMDGMKYDEGRFAMRPGDILVAYSDGVTEPENDFGEFGEERMMEVVRQYRDQPLHVISAQVMQALDAWIGAEEQPDDITLVLARQT